MLFPVLAFIAVFLLTSSLGALIFYRHSALLGRRLLRMVSAPEDATLLRKTAPASARIEKLVKPFQSVVPRSPEAATTVAKRLTRAGYREESAVNIFYSSKFLVPGILCVLATVTQAYVWSPLFVYALAGGMGFLIPDFWLGNRVTARQTAIRLGLPDALDLIVICVEAGFSMDKATMRTAEELRISQPAIADELNLVYLEQKAGCPRAEAWRRFADRTGVDAIQTLTAMLIQADKYGSSVGKTLRVHSETLRTTRRQDAEEQAAKTAAKLVFPLVLFIFPSLFAVTLGPSVIVMMQGFAKFFG
jgi:tight adherence protein C